jgi:Uma2 family endonuclease
MSQAVTKPVRRAATYEDLLAVPEPLVAEILFGELVTHPRPLPRHARAAIRLGTILSGSFELGINGPGGWVFLPEPELHLNGHVVVPDLAGWHLDRLPELPETVQIEVAPDWICEVLSPSTESYNRGEKRLIYAEAGVSHVWHTNPLLKLLEVYELRNGKWLLLDVFSDDDAQVAAAPFAGLSFALRLLWESGPQPSAPPPSARAPKKRLRKGVKKRTAP